MTTWLFCAAPWLLGLFLSLHLSRLFAHSPSVAAVIAVNAAVIGYLLLAICLFTFQSLKIGDLTLGSLTLVACCYGLYLLSTVPSKILKMKSLRSWSVWQYSLLMLLLFSIGHNAYLASLLPAFGWDTLDYWAVHSIEFINKTSSGVTVGWDFTGTHPPTIAILGAWSAAIANKMDAAGPLYAPWILCWVSIVLCLVGHTYFFSNSPSFSLLVGVIASGLPLGADHSVIGGYADLFLAAGIVGATAVGSVAIRCNDKSLVIVSCLIGCTSIFYKNIGFLYSICVIWPGTAYLICRTHLSLKWYAKIALMLPLLGASVLLFVFFVTGESELFIGNRVLRLSLENSHRIPLNFFASQLSNTSFSVTFLLAAAVFIAIITIPSRLTPELIFVGSVCAINFSLLFFAQLSDYFFTYSLPESDTSLSRLSLGLSFCALLILPILLDIFLDNESGSPCASTSTD